MCFFFSLSLSSLSSLFTLFSLSLLLQSLHFALRFALLLNSLFYYSLLLFSLCFFSLFLLSPTQLLLISFWIPFLILILFHFFSSICLCFFNFNVLIFFSSCRIFISMPTLVRNQCNKRQFRNKYIFTIRLLLLNNMHATTC